MGEQCTIAINGRRVQVSKGTSVAAAMMMALDPCRVSVSGEARGPVCGMGICMECCATVNGIAHRRTCQLVCAQGMEIETG